MAFRGEGEIDDNQDVVGGQGTDDAGSDAAEAGGGDDQSNNGEVSVDANAADVGDITDGSTDSTSSGMSLSGSPEDPETEADIDYGYYDGGNESEHGAGAYKSDQITSINPAGQDHSGNIGITTINPAGQDSFVPDKKDNSQDMEISETHENPYAKNPGQTEFYSSFQQNRYSQEAIQDRLKELKPAQQTRMINHQMALLEKRMKDAAYKPGFLGEHTWGMWHKNSVKNQIDKMIDDFEEIYGETMTQLSKENSKKVNEQGIQLQGTDFLSMTKMGTKVMQGLFAKLGMAYHPIEAEKKFRALKEKYGLADEDDKWYHKSEAENVLTGMTKESCNARAGWYWDDTAKICRRGVDPNKEEESDDDRYTIRYDPITGKPITS